MQLNQVPAKTGYLWFRQGIWLFRRNPMGFLAAFIAYILAMMVISILPLVGSLLPLVLIPGASVGFMAACREAILGKPFFPTVLVSGFRSNGPNAARHLLVLGIAYALAIALVFGLSALADGGQLMRLMLFGGVLDEKAVAGGDTSLAIMIAMAGYIPVAMLFWFSPVLVAWHGVPPHKAVFFSWMACWRNRGAFIVYGVAWMAVVVAMSFGVTLLLQLLGAGAIALQLLMPLSVIVMIMLYCSFYATYRGCFDVSDPAVPETTAPPKPGA